MTAGVHLLVPIKPLHRAKSRLRGTAGAAGRTARAHADLVAAVALDTVLAAQQATGVREVVVVTSDPMLTDSFASEGVEVIADGPDEGLNAALRHGADVLGHRPSTARIGALQADLPALRPEELDSALHAAGELRAFCPDRHGTGTTMLLAGTGRPLDPRFGPDSARLHSRSGGSALLGAWETLRCDVDTEADLLRAGELGLGPRTAARLAIEPGTPHQNSRWSWSR